MTSLSPHRHLGQLIHVSTIQKVHFLNVHVMVKKQACLNASHVIWNLIYPSASHAILTLTFLSVSHAITILHLSVTHVRLILIYLNASHVKSIQIKIYARHAILIQIFLNVVGKNVQSRVNVSALGKRKIHRELDAIPNVVAGCFVSVRHSY